MKAVVVFHDQVEQAHPLSGFLRPGFWHCFVCVEAGGDWIRLDGRRGVPNVRRLAPMDFDIAGFYRAQNCTVVETVQCPRPAIVPLAWRTCVGFVKAFLCIRTWAVTPYGLYRHLIKQ